MNYVCYERAYAKINLFLDVLGRREDGYHDIVSVMQSVSLHDEVEVSVSVGSTAVAGIPVATAARSVSAEATAVRSVS
ncbi:MAG: hypothetical protein FWH55_11725, partial [Oscillospiraceae bacterium]|nr:hypothetical protein [Oscillospiraceae bacterium]